MHGHTAESHFADQPVTIRMVRSVGYPGRPVMRFEHQGVVAEPDSGGAKAGHLDGWADCANFLPGDMNVAEGEQANGVNAELIGDDLARPEAQFKSYKNT